jgi:hypothetical protein
MLTNVTVTMSSVALVARGKVLKQEVNATVERVVPRSALPYGLEATHDDPNDGGSPVPRLLMAESGIW